ncbi:PLC-like phosphodiesterase [Mycena rebaudengoi]|nr:PLC-like phosphodiesterase [Mycena rebaudengoi]
MFSRSTLSALVSVATLGLAATIPIKRATVCNGHAELCDRSYGNVTFVGSHDSAFFDKNPLALARDQEIDIPSQLAAGVRLLQSQSHMNDGVLHFCHTSCALFDGGPVLDYLKNVKTFLDANKDEVLTLIFTNPEGVSVKDVWKPIFDEAGISDLAFVPPALPVKRSDWPTLGSMIDSGKRVVVFLDANADPAAVPFILPEFQMVWETPFSRTDPTFPCAIDRIDGPLAAEDHMYMINHSLNKNIIPIGDGVLVSDPIDAPTTNGVESILAEANGCNALGGGRAPNFVLLDYINLGDPFAAVNQLNGLAPPPAATPDPSLPSTVAGDVKDAVIGAADDVKDAVTGAVDGVKSTACKLFGIGC